MRAPTGRTECYQYDNAYEAFRELPIIAGLELARQKFNYAPFGWLQTLDAMSQPTLLLGHWSEQAHIVYRDRRSLHEIIPLPRPLEHLVQSLTLFSALVKRRGVQVPQILLDDAKFGPERVALQDIDEPLRYRLMVAATDQLLTEAFYCF